MKPLRVLLTVLVTLVAGGGLAVAQEALQATPKPPEIVTDLEGPLFLLEQMTPGVPIERCVTVYPRAGTAGALLLSARVVGSLTHLVHQEVTAGSATDGVRATRTCEGFEPERDLWAGSLDEFPTEDAPITDAASLAPGRPRVYRFRVWVAETAVLRLDELAEQDLTWTAELEPVVPPTTAPPTTAPPTTVTVTTPAVTQTATTPVRPPATVTAAPPKGVPVPITPSAPIAPSCVAQPSERPSATVVVGGRRATFIVGPTRRLRAGEPLVLRVRDTAGVIARATYEVDGRRLPAAATRPWRARMPVAVLRRGGSRVVVRIETTEGAVRYRHVDLRPSGCPSIVRAIAPAATPDRLVLSLDPGRALRGATVVLPSGVATADTAVRTTSGLRVVAVPRNRRLALGPMPAGVQLVLTTRVGGAHRDALDAARCGRAPVKLRLDPVDGPSQWVVVPLQGRGGGCSR